MSQPKKIRPISPIRVRKNIRVWIILCWPLIPRIPRIYTMSQPKKIRPIRAISVRKKHSRMNYIMLTTNLPNQTNHLICRLNQKKNPSIIPFVLSRHNQNEEWRMKNEELSASPIKKQRSATEGKANEFPCEPLWTCMVHNYSLPLQKHQTKQYLESNIRYDKQLNLYRLWVKYFK